MIWKEGRESTRLLQFPCTFIFLPSRPVLFTRSSWQEKFKRIGMEQTGTPCMYVYIHVCMYGVHTNI